MGEGSQERYDNAIQQIRDGEQDAEMEDAFEESQPWQWEGRKAVIVDTNILLSKLVLLDEAARLLARAFSDGSGGTYLCGFIIPHQVRLELNSLKRRRVELSACHRATLWMTSMLTNPARVVYFQGRHERHRDLEDLLRGLEGKNGLRKEIAKGDELILDCVEYFHDRTGGLTSLLTNDRNFANEALGHGIKVITTLDRSDSSARHILSEGFGLQLTPLLRTPPLFSTPPSGRGSSLEDSKHAPPRSGSVSPSTPLRKVPSPAPPAIAFPKLGSDDLSVWRAPPDLDSLSMAIDIVLALCLKDRLSMISSLQTGAPADGILLTDGGPLSPGDGVGCLSTIDKNWDAGVRPFVSRRCDGDAVEVKTMRTRVRNLHERLVDAETNGRTTLAWRAVVEEVGAVLKGSGMLAAKEEALVDDAVAGWSSFLVANPMPVAGTNGRMLVG